MIAEGKLPGPDMDVTAPYIERKGWDIPSLILLKILQKLLPQLISGQIKVVLLLKCMCMPKKEDLIAVVREAHKRNLKVTGHIGTITYREAAELGIDDLEHGFFVSSDFDKDKKENEYDDEREYRTLANVEVNSAEMKSLIQFLIKKNVAITSTLPVFEPYTNRELILGGGENALLPEVKEIVTARWQRSQGKDSASLVLFKKEMALGKTIL